MASLGGLSLRDLEYALAVAEHRHFGRAAGACGVSQPALSEQVRKLESLLGVTLFERARGRVAPTVEGEHLLRQAGTVVRHARALLEMGLGQSETPLGALRLGVIPTLGPYYLPFLLRSVREAFPALDMELAEAKTPALVDGLRAGRLDMVLAALPLGEEGLTTVALFDEPFHLAVPSGHALEGLERLVLDDLVGEDLLLLEEGHCLRDQTISLCRVGERAARSGRARQASSLEMLRHMIAAGEGFSLLPLLAVRDGRDWEGLVATRAIPDSRARRTVGVGWRSSDPRDGQFRQFAGFLRESAPPGTGVAR